MLLALTYYLGVSSVAAQGMGSITVATLTSSSPPGILFANDHQVRLAGSSAPCASSMMGSPIPGTSRIIQLGFGGSAEFNVVAVLESGDVYALPTGQSSWVLQGNLLCGPVPVAGATWGRVKADRR